MPGTLAQILATKADLVDGKLKTDQLPSSVTGTQITVSPTPPNDPQINDLWIDSSE